MFSNLIAIFEVPVVPKKPVPEEKKPIPVPKKKEAPPAKGINPSHDARIGDSICLLAFLPATATCVLPCALFMWALVLAIRT